MQLIQYKFVKYFVFYSYLQRRILDFFGKWTRLIRIKNCLAHRFVRIKVSDPTQIKVSHKSLTRLGIKEQTLVCTYHSVI